MKLIMGSSNTKDQTIIRAGKEKKNELTIYTCGNIKEIKKFNIKEVGGENYMEQDIGDFDEKHKKFDWFFNFHVTEMNEEYISGIMKKISAGYRNRNNSNNNIILVFLDSQKKIQENKNKIKLILEHLDKLKKIYKPIILFSCKNNQIIEEETDAEEGDIENLIDDIIKENKYNNYYIKKYIEIIYYSEYDYSKIISKINSIYCYFNNIGDIFSILDEMIRGYNFYNNKMRNRTKFVSTFNILVLGRPGSGKSTLINLLLNKRKAREGIGESVTKVISKYVHDKYPITLEDTPGFEDDYDLKKMIDFLSKSNDIFKGGKNEFHLVLYLINSSNERTFIGEEVQLIDFIEKQMKIPIFFVCTRSKNKEYSKDFEEVVKMNLWQNFGEKTNLVNNIYCCHLLNEKDGVYKRFGIDELLKGIQSYFIKEIEKKEKELLTNKTDDIIKDTIVIEDETPDDSKFLTGLKNPEQFEDYLERIALKIIEDYEYYTYSEELKKDKNIKSNDNNNEKINELLVDHLALELNGKSTGNIFCKRNREEVMKNVENNIIVVPSKICLKSKTEKIYIKGISIENEDIKKSIRTTKEFGMEAKKQFLNEMRNEEKGFEKYLKIIINNYKEAIHSLTDLYKIIE